ncbi:hypothetical protein [Methanobrevibacter sp.]|uniref:hypothetical protein n=1 Tax=Methanobrevibacter sp. TaxID=66852 RepID=UPI003869F93D
MQDKIIVTPESVRGLGNIVIPKSSSDFENYNSVISSDTEEVNGTEMTVYTLDYDGRTVLLTVPQSYVRTSETITVTVTLTDENGNPIEDAAIELYKEVE